MGKRLIGGVGLIFAVCFAVSGLAIFGVHSIYGQNAPDDAFTKSMTDNSAPGSRDAGLIEAQDDDEDDLDYASVNRQTWYALNVSQAYDDEDDDDDIDNYV